MVYDFEFFPNIEEKSVDTNNKDKVLWRDMSYEEKTNIFKKVYSEYLIFEDQYFLDNLTAYSEKNSK